MASPFVVSDEMVGFVLAWRERQLHDPAIRPLIPSLREAFDLDNAQAIAICCDAALLRRSEPVTVNVHSEEAEPVTGVIASEDRVAPEPEPDADPGVWDQSNFDIPSESTEGENDAA